MKKRSTMFISCGILTLLLTTSSWAQIPIYSQDFEGSGMPDGWTQETNADDGGWLFGTSSQLESVGYPIPEHTNMAVTNDDACNCDKSSDILITPPLDFSSYSVVFLQFDAYFGHLYFDAQEEAYILVSTDGGVNWTTVDTLAGSTEWTTPIVDLSVYGGNSNVLIGFKYDDGGGWGYGWAIDNVSVYSPIEGIDVSVTAVDIGKLDPTPVFINLDKYISGLPLSVHATIFNQGTVPITSFDITWTDGTNSFTESITGVTINATESYEYTSSNSYITLSGSNTITVTISNVNGGVTETSTSNNSMGASVEGVVPNPDQNYLAEEATGTWCGWCPRGAVFMEYMYETYPEQFIGIAVHNSDPMEINEYDNWVGSFPGFLGYPSIIINRSYIIDPSQLEEDFINNIENAPAVKVTVDATINTTSNELMATLNAEFLLDLSGDYRFVAILEEDSVHGTTSTYAQANYYSGGSVPMAGYEDLPDMIPASQMYYEFVARELLSDVEGTQGSLPATLTSGNSYSYVYNLAVPSSYNINHLKVVGMVVNHSTGEVLNSGSSPLNIGTGIANLPVNASLFVYPNPAQKITYLDLKIAKAAEIRVEVVNAIGQSMLLQSFGKLNGDQILPIDLNNFASGVYQVKVKVGEEVLYKKLDIIK